MSLRVGKVVNTICTDDRCDTPVFVCIDGGFVTGGCVPGPPGGGGGALGGMGGGFGGAVVYYQLKDY